MQSSDIPTEAFAEAHTEALEQTPEIQRESFLAENIAQALVDKLVQQGYIEAREEVERVRNKVAHAIRGIQQERGIEYLTDEVNRSGFRVAFFHRLAARMTLSDMPQSVKKASGEFRLNLPKSIK